MLDLNPVYNYYSTVYSPKTQTKYDSHKKSELKSLYNNIVKANKESPLFKVTVNDSIQNYAIGLKSAAIGLRNFSEFLADQEENAFSKLTAQSSDAQSISAQVITTDYSSLPESMEFTVEDLASPQVNKGEMVENNELSISPGPHAFSITTNGRNYSFNLNVKDNDTNLHVQNRVANFINQSGIGVHSYVEQNAGYSRLALESDSEGTENTRQGLQFSIQDQSNDSVLSAYNLDNVEAFPSDAYFTINGMAQTASSNNIAINKMVEIELQKPTSDPVHLQFVPDTQDIINKIKDFTGSYNQIIDIADSNSSDQRGAKKLLHEISGITSRHHSALESVGLNVDDNGRMVTDDALLSQSVTNGEIKHLFTDLSGFKEDIEDKTQRISLDPMNYVDKTVITYPNPGRTFANPYMPSIYSGMLYNYYV